MKFVKPIISLLFVGIMLSCDDGVESPYLPLTFKAIAALPGEGRSSAVACSLNGKGYVMLGRDSNAADSLKDCWQYDPEADSWAVVTTFPGLARVKAVTAVLNNKIYVGLGYKPHVSTYVNANYKDFWEYDVALNAWTQKASLPSTATDACVSFVFKGCIYIGEGFNDIRFTNEFWKFDTAKNVWIQLKDFPGDARAGATVCADSVHIFFGTGYRFGNYSDWWEYFPESDSWIQRKDMPSGAGRVNAVSLNINHRSFVASGRYWGGTQTNGHLKSDVLEYDVNRNVWYRRGNIPTGGRENAVSFVINGKGYIGQGENDSRIFNDFWCFEP
jgi:N-acetylneuraminic acid mutarotase